jgi:hypothetical protein
MLPEYNMKQGLFQEEQSGAYFFGCHNEAPQCTTQQFFSTHFLAQLLKTIVWPDYCRLPLSSNGAQNLALDFHI